MSRTIRDLAVFIIQISGHVFYRLSLFFFPHVQSPAFEYPVPFSSPNSSCMFRWPLKCSHLWSRKRDYRTVIIYSFFSFLPVSLIYFGSFFFFFFLSQTKHTRRTNEISLFICENKLYMNNVYANKKAIFIFPRTFVRVYVIIIRWKRGEEGIKYFQGTLVFLRANLSIDTQPLCFFYTTLKRSNETRLKERV